jgi:pimeloyl-ACP methyl ester carboxylesterase
MQTVAATPGPSSRSRTRRRGYSLLKWTGRALLGLLALVVALPLAGATYQAVATQLDRRAFPPPGQLVDVGGRRLHLSCLGSGSPTVILEAGASGTSAHWAWVQPAVAAATRVCAYDRAGMGWSDPGPEPRDAGQVAADLHTLLTNAGIDGPYLLAGHSFGGLFARAYAARYPDEVAGLVLVDATHPDLWRRLPPPLATPPNEQPVGLFPILAGLGAMRLGLITPFPVDADLPAQQREEIAALTASTAAMAAIAAELRAFPATAAQVRVAGDLDDRPLAVLTAGSGYATQPPDVAVPARQAWAELQADLATLSSNRVHRTVAGATHESLVYSQRDARATVAAILQVVEAVRTNQRLIA